MADKMKPNGRRQAITSSVIGLCIGVILSAISTEGSFIIGVLTASLLSAGAVFLLQLTLSRFKADKTIRTAVFLAFFIRLVIGVLLFVLLPAYGYDEPYNNAGYLYLDAFRRDADAWQLAASSAPISAAFQAEFSTDQYGGLLSLSAFIYRYFSPDAHRPLLVLILTSFFSAFGIVFLWDAVKKRWNGKIANASAWILALYPESIILGASQMREPILIGLSAIIFWGVTAWKTAKKQAAVAMVLSLAAMVFISSKAAAAIFAVTTIWFWMDNIYHHSNSTIKVFSWIAIALLLSAGILAGWNWLVDSSRWDISLMESASGRIQWELELLGEKFQAPFIITYGLAQPVLPAAIVYPGIPLTRFVAIFRALGWYLLVPLMIAGFVMLWRRDNKHDRKILLFFYLVSIIWTIISSARAGGDQWDNPRYRSIFLVWMAFIGAWAWVQTLKKRSLWLWRLLLLEVIYISFFIQWYLSRYYGIFKRMDFLPMIRLLLIIGLAIIGGGIVFDLVLEKIQRGKEDH